MIYSLKNAVAFVIEYGMIVLIEVLCFLVDTPSKKNEKKSKEPCGTPPNCCLESETVRDQIRNLNSQSHSSPQALQNRNSPQGMILYDMLDS